MMVLVVIKTPQETLNLTDPELFSCSVNNLAAFEQPIISRRRVSLSSPTVLHRTIARTITYTLTWLYLDQVGPGGYVTVSPWPLGR